MSLLLAQQQMRAQRAQAPNPGVFSAEQVARATAAPLVNVATCWPVIVAALQEVGIDDRAVETAAAATVAIETGEFLPIEEYGSGEQYEGRADLGNVYPGDGPRFKGRGFCQITGRYNYRRFGGLLGLPLEADPNLALDPVVAARILAAYFVERGIPGLARAGDWAGVRRAVNGGLTGFDRFLTCVRLLEAT